VGEGIAAQLASMVAARNKERMKAFPEMENVPD
jgi:hypothetical protein